MHNALLSFSYPPTQMTSHMTSIWMEATRLRLLLLLDPEPRSWMHAVCLSSKRGMCYCRVMNLPCKMKVVECGENHLTTSFTFYFGGLWRSAHKSWINLDPRHQRIQSFILTGSNMPLATNTSRCMTDARLVTTKVKTLLNQWARFTLVNLSRDNAKQWLHWVAQWVIDHTWISSSPQRSLSPLEASSPSGTVVRHRNIRLLDDVQMRWATKVRRVLNFRLKHNLHWRQCHSCSIMSYFQLVVRLERSL